MMLRRSHARRPLTRGVGIAATIAMVALTMSGCGTKDAEAPPASEIPEGDVPEVVTTADSYEYVPAEKLPPVRGASSYVFDEEAKIVKFPINVWIGWLPIVAANHGFAPNEESVFFKEFGFKVELKLIDDPLEARQTYASGQSHILWGTLDMMVLFAPGLMQDSRTAPRICQQIDWSAGGDGIVVRDSIESVADLKGKTIVYAQNSPSEYYLNRLLLDAGLKPSDITTKYTATAFEAARALVSDPSVDGCVSWAPDIYNIPEKVKGTKTLATTADDDTMIADVWAVRADFAKDHPDIVQGLVDGIFLGMAEVAKDPAPALKWLAEGFDFPEDEIKAMMADARSTPLEDNKAFFLDPSNESNFENTWKKITEVYTELDKIDEAVKFDQVMDFTYVKAAAEK